jgi:hypothetical protein
VPVPQRTARIEDEIWTPAQARAQAEGASLAALMRAAVQRYASGELTSQALPATRPGLELTSQADAASRPDARVTSQATAAAIASIGPGAGLPRRPLLRTWMLAEGHGPLRPPPPGPVHRLRRRPPGAGS